MSPATRLFTMAAGVHHLTQDLRCKRDIASASGIRETNGQMTAWHPLRPDQGDGLLATLA